jgi:hypothetical protein
MDLSRLEKIAGQVQQMQQQMAALLAAQRAPDVDTHTTACKPAANQRKRRHSSCSSPENQYVRIAKGFLGTRNYKWFGGAEVGMCGVCQLAADDA